MPAGAGVTDNRDTSVMMTNDRLTVSAYWGARREPAERCAERMKAFLDELRDISDSFASWYLEARSPRDAQAQPVVVETADLTRLVLAGINRRDDDGAPLPELGFRLGAWAGDPDGITAGLSATCGSHNAHLENVCVLTVTEGHDLDGEIIARIVDAAIRAWEPDGVEVNANRVYERAR